MTYCRRNAAPLRILLVLILLAGLLGCTSMPHAPAGSCVQRTLDSLSLAGLPDGRQHCLASANLTLRCGRTAALAAGYGKEIHDLFGRGDFQWHDLSANRAGRRCAAVGPDADALVACCAAAGY